jgi:hypothetical protein
MIGAVAEDGTEGAAVIIQVLLSIADEIQPVEPDAAFDRVFEDAGLPGLL